MGMTESAHSGMHLCPSMIYNQQHCPDKRQNLNVFAKSLNPTLPEPQRRTPDIILLYRHPNVNISKHQSLLRRMKYWREKIVFNPSFQI